MAEVNGILNGATGSVDSDAGGYPASQAIDGNSGTFWHSGGSLPHWIKYDLGSPKAGGNYKVKPRISGDAHAWVDFTFEGSNDDVEWTVLDGQVGLNWTTGEEKSFICGNIALYRYYRWHITKTTSMAYATAAELSIAESTLPLPRNYLAAGRRNRLCMKGVSVNNLE